MEAAAVICPPHPACGHLLPGGEKGILSNISRRGEGDYCVPSPRRGEGVRAFLLPGGEKVAAGRMRVESRYLDPHEKEPRRGRQQRVRLNIAIEHQLQIQANSAHTNSNEQGGRCAVARR